jgi:hypothetical protein
MEEYIEMVEYKNVITEINVYDKSYIIINKEKNI